MLVPYAIARSMFDEFFDSGFSGHSTNLMRTDIKEMDNGYELTVDLPGVKKEDLSAELKDGYLQISATIGTGKDQNDDGKYLRRERFAGSFRRSFYVGESLRQEDIHAKFEDGTLKLFIPKTNTVVQSEPKNLIAIEG